MTVKLSRLMLGSTGRDCYFFLLLRQYRRIAGCRSTLHEALFESESPSILNPMEKAMRSLNLLASLLAPLALAMLLATPADAGGGQIGGRGGVNNGNSGGVNNGNSSKCASGHIVKNTKMCKENGGTK